MIHWFRRDLRLAHNPALAWIEAQQASLLPCYIHAPEEEAPWPPGAASRWWLHHSLTALASDLAAHGVALQSRRAASSALSLLELCRASGASTVTANRRYEPTLAARDRQVAAQLAHHGITLQLFDDGILCPPGELLNRQQRPYRVFTPFAATLRQRLITPPATAPAAASRSEQRVALAATAEAEIAALHLLDPHPWHQRLQHHWRPGETSATAALQRFLESALGDYPAAREIPASPGTSRLSPHLHFGELALSQILTPLLPLLGGEGGAAAAAGAERFYLQLAWREFARHLLHHYPDSDQKPLNPRFHTGTLWHHQPAALTAWQRGRSGIALVDAGMAELWESGWMHNRVRMVVGSLLTKNLAIHWLEGARWFWDTLVDADLASNSMGWQWIQGSGADAAPYFRIFNPVRQGERFDPEGEYVRHWIPELQRLPTRHIHAPWQATGEELRQAGIRLGRDYPQPIVDLADSRKQALDAYAAIRTA